MEDICHAKNSASAAVCLSLAATYHAAVAHSAASCDAYAATQSLHCKCVKGSEVCLFSCPFF
jgi:hypothetical protein